MSGPAGTTRRRCRRAWSFSLPSSTRAQCAQRAPALGLALSITHEEMMHLHYVQCLLRALGEPADFTLPERSAGSDNWRFEGWRARTGPAEPQQATEVRSMR